VLIPKAGATSYAGDVLAVVVAESRQAARGCHRARRRDVRAAAAVDRPMAAMASDQVACVGYRRERAVALRLRPRDVGAALAASAHVVHEVFQTQRVEHAFLEPESSLAVPRPDGGLHVYSGARDLGRP